MRFTRCKTFRKRKDYEAHFFHTQSAPPNVNAACITPGGTVGLVVQNIMDKTAPYEYRIATGGGNPCACDIIKSLFGRTISIRLQKEF